MNSSTTIAFSGEFILFKIDFNFIKKHKMIKLNLTMIIIERTIKLYQNI